MDNDIVYTAGEEGIPMSRLTEADACMKSRNFSYTAKDTSQPENYFRTIIVKDTIKNALIYNCRNEKYIMQYMLTRYAECGFKNYQQKQAQLLWDHRRVMRYLKDEVRQPSFPKGGVVKIGSRMYTVHVDAAFECGDQVELVCFKIGKPHVTQTGRGGAFQRDMQLYALQLYGRSMELAKKYGREKPFANITASFYYLRKTSDGPYWNQCEQHFFGGGGNIIQITDLYDGVPNELDKKMESLISLNEKGINEADEKEDTCRYCDYFDICKYELPPVKIEEHSSDNPSTAKVEFSAQQEKAIAVRDGVTRIVAGAGSGKTKTIVARVEAMLSEGTAPEEICMMTFTKAGADEMKRRIERDYGAMLPGLTVSTFNAFENEIVKDQWKKLGFSRKPDVIDDVGRFSIIAGLLNKNPILEWTGRSFINFSVSRGYGTRGALRIASDVFSAVKASKAKNGTVNMADVREAASYDEIGGKALTKLTALYDKYEKIMKEKGLIDFDDQEMLAFKVIQDDPGYLGRTYKFKHVIVDEFQDTSEGQIEMLKELIKIPSFESLMVVGDDFQSIYGFRDTTPEYIVHFEDYIGKKVNDIVLDMNYRSTPQICSFGNNIITPNRDKVEKKLIAARPSGKPVIVNGFYQKNDEINYITAGIKQHLDDGVKPEDIAGATCSATSLQR